MVSEPPGAIEHFAERHIAIIGAGPTGLGAAYRLDELGLRNFRVFEREHHAGGLAASFRDAAGFTWDVGGHVQFSHYDYFDRAMDRAMGDEWLFHDRESWVWIRECFVPYPFQNNIHFLPDAEMRACLRGLLRRPQTRPASVETFADWIRARFGDGIAELFMLPYNAKVWAYPPSDLGFGWVGDRVAEVDLERVIFNMLDGRADVSWGPNNQFRFPARGGTGEIWRRLAAALPPGAMRYGAHVTGVDVNGRQLRFGDGSCEDYDVLITTMPLDQFADLAGDELSTPAARALRHSTVHVFGIGLRGAPPPHLGRKCWIYYPEDDCPFYRLTVFSNYSPANVPDPARYWSVMVEVSESPKKPVERERLRECVIEGLLATRVIDSRDDIVSIWEHTVPHGYPTPFLGRDDIVVPMLEVLEQKGVFSRGRFGAWKYEVSNQDHSFMQGVELVDRLAFGKTEATLHHPDLVNAGRR